MPKVLLIESRSHFGSLRSGFAHDLARALALGATRPTLLLVQNGVLHARTRGPAGRIVELLAAGIPVLADDFSLRERGIAPEQLAAGVLPSALDIVVDRLVDGWQVIWH